jgi:hypothetical protein
VKNALAASSKHDDKMPLSALAKSYGGTLKTLTINRLSKNPPAPLDAEAAMALFNAEKGEIVTQAVGKGIIVGEVQSATLPALASIPKDKIDSVNQIAMRGMRDSILGTYLDVLRRKYKVTVNDALLKQTYDKKAGAEDSP